MVVCLSHFFLFVGLAHSKDKQRSRRDRVCVNKAYELSKVKEKENILYFGLLPVLSLRGGGIGKSRGCCYDRHMLERLLKAAIDIIMAKWQQKR